VRPEASRTSSALLRNRKTFQSIWQAALPRVAGEICAAIHLDRQALRERQSALARIALNCAITAYHMAEWVWGDWLNKNEAIKKQLGITDLDSFKAWIDARLPEFTAVQSITNGTKHFNRKAFGQARRVEAVLDGNVFAPDAYQTRTFLMVEIVRKTGPIMVEVECVVEDLIVFWRASTNITGLTRICLFRWVLRRRSRTEERNISGGRQVRR
jgi:hypothetical protein